MDPTNRQPQGSLSVNETQIITLHRQLMESWNGREAAAFAALFAVDGNVAGFDGSPVDGRA
jgi:hypothetical protein